MNPKSDFGGFISDPIAVPVTRKMALVAVENSHISFDMLFSYEIPEEFSDKISPGVRVVVPFGRGNKKRIGLVFEITDEIPEKKCKSVFGVVDDEPVISVELLRLCEWLRDNTFCTYYDAFRAILPPGLGYSLKRQISLSKSFSGGLTAHEESFMRQLESADKAGFAALIAAGHSTVDKLIAKGALVEDHVAKRRVGDENVQMVRAGEEYDPGNPEQKLTAKQQSVMELLAAVGSASVHEVCYNCAVTSAVVKRLIEKNILEQFELTAFRTENNAEASENPEDIIFSPKQQTVYNGLLELMNDDAPRCALLRGITGSGKTSVFIRLINEAVKQGKSAIMMVPEIALTPQMVGKFRRLFGREVAIMHSALSIGERADEYRRICEGRAHIVIGTRSAVFAPAQNIGIIVIDEEGEGSYKSESSPRYHARDAAKQRCFAHGALLLLASATPSPESYYFAKNGRYSLFEIDERYNNAVLPEVFIIDMSVERQNGNSSSFSEPLVHEIEENLKRGEQSILLLNRRGYRTSVRCLSCGKPLECPNCSMPLTYHKVNDCVICHCCGYMRRLDRVCPKCGGGYFNMKGEGTQLVQDELSVMFPSARILRMDTDTTSSKGAYERDFGAFGRGEYDIMVGTQMIAKGLDFPNVTLVGVLKIDNSLYAADFRAYERTFSLITQVVGRAGRGGKRGRAMLQTFSPEHFVINLAANQNYPDFYNEEIELRQARFYPPFCDITVFGFASISSSQGEKAARKFARLLSGLSKEQNGKVPLRILGPAPNTVGRVNGRYRFTLIAKCSNSPEYRGVVREALKRAYADKDFEQVAFYADINGNIE